MKIKILFLFTTSILGTSFSLPSSLLGSNALKKPCDCDNMLFEKVLPKETICHIFSFLEAESLASVERTNKKLHRLASDHFIWKKVMIFYPLACPFFAKNGQINHKHSVIKEALKIQIFVAFLEEDVKKIQILMEKVKHDLNIDSNIRCLFDFERLIDLRDQKAIQKRVDELSLDFHNGFPNFTVIVINQSIEKYVAEGNPIAIERKINGLINGWYNYPQNFKAAKILIEKLFEQGNKYAIDRKIKGLANGEYGYHQNIELAKENLEKLIQSGNRYAIEEKLFALIHGLYDYNPDCKTTRNFIDSLAAKGNTCAIKRKIDGIANGYYGYNKNLTLSRELIEDFAKQGYKFALKKKIQGLNYGKNGYTKNDQLLREFIDHLAQKENRYGIKKKFKGLKSGKYGYYKDLEALREFIEELGKKRNQYILKKKIRGLAHGKYGYIKDVKRLNLFTEELFQERHPIGFKLKIAKFLGLIDPKSKEKTEFILLFVKKHRIHPFT